ncbi:LuxR C-terminal-related transcriptional regulator [Streptomyces albulus]|nr:LuxR C-terminal-related transcriptional regulator [Streptomyces noursei]
MSWRTHRSPNAPACTPAPPASSTAPAPPTRTSPASCSTHLPSASPGRSKRCTAASGPPRRSEFARAATWLNRALEEPQRPEQRARIGLDLASAEAVAAPVASDRRLAAVVRSPGDGETWSHLRVRALDMGLARGDDSWGRCVAAEALETAQGRERDDLIALYWYAVRCRPEVRDVPAPGVPALPDTPRPAQAGVRAGQLATLGQQRERAAELAAGRWKQAARCPSCPAWSRSGHCGSPTPPPRPRATSTPSSPNCAAATAVPPRPRPGPQRRPASARRSRGRGPTRHGRRRDGRCPPSPGTLRGPHLMAVRCVIAMESGRHDEARALTAAPTPPDTETSVHWPLLLFIRARVAADEGRWAEAVELFKESGRWLVRRQWPNPAVLPWRSLAALACLRLGDRQQARRLIHEELTLARRWGAPSAVSLAELCARALDQPGTAASTTVPIGPNHLAHAWALADLTTEEATKGDRTAAARLLTELSDHRVTRTSSRLAARVRSLADRLEPTADPEVSTLDREWAVLSPAERQTAVLACGGLGNRQIAEQLSVSRRTVELRLSSTYKKLRIASREELRSRYRLMEGT